MASLALLAWLSIELDILSVAFLAVFWADSYALREFNNSFKLFISWSENLPLPTASNEVSYAIMSLICCLYSTKSSLYLVRFSCDCSYIALITEESALYCGFSLTKSSIDFLELLITSWAAFASLSNFLMSPEPFISFLSKYSSAFNACSSFLASITPWIASFCFS